MSITKTPTPQPGDRLAELLRLTMRGVASTVSIVTALGADGARQGATVTSMTSVSLSPPSLLVVLNGAARTHAAILATRAFAVAVLGEKDRDLAALFADPTRHAERFASSSWLAGDHGVPVLEGAVATFICAAAECRPFGTHTVFIGTVERVIAGPAQSPLLYHNRRYRRLGEDIHGADQ